MKTYTEEQVKEILQLFAEMVDDRYSPNVNIAWVLDLSENYINSLLSPQEKETAEETYKFSFKVLTKKIMWDDLCEIIGVDWYKKSCVEDGEIFEIKESDCKKYGLL